MDPHTAKMSPKVSGGGTVRQVTIPSAWTHPFHGGITSRQREVPQHRMTEIRGDRCCQSALKTQVKAEQEAERKRIEAQGIADFQRIVSTGIDDPLLRWKGIE